MSKRVIRAKYDENTITVYQAYNNEIAQPAVQHKTFVSPPFKIERMTWIKPSFLLPDNIVTKIDATSESA